MSIPDEENQLSQASTAGQSSTGEATDNGTSIPAPNGYIKLAEVMAAMPALGMFRRFGVLNALSLLFYQAELVKLEREFFQQAVCDDNCEDALKRWEIVGKIRQTLEKYNKQMLLQHKLVSLDKPSVRDIEFLRTWMHREDLGNVKLQGPDRGIWRLTYLPEFVALDARKPVDALSSWVTAFVVDIYHYLIGRHTRESSHEFFKGSSLYSEDSIERIVWIAVVDLSSLFPISSILLLNHFEDQQTRMIILCVYTLCFSGILAAVSGVKRHEVFSAAAAFAAVQVVFISQNKQN